MNFECNSCSHKFENSNNWNKCPKCEFDATPLGPFYTNVYLIDKAYGGPEEGGWWYICGEPVESRLAETRDEADQMLDILSVRCKDLNEGCRPISSVLSQGEYAVYLEDHFACTFPQSRPYYE